VADLGALTRPQRQMLDESAATIRSLGRVCLESAGRIGRELTRVKRAVGHGSFLAWLDREFAWSCRTAQNLMNLAELLNSQTFRNLTPDQLARFDLSAAYLLARPSTPEDARSAAAAAATNGERITLRNARRHLDDDPAERRNPPPADETLAWLPQLVRGLRLIASLELAPAAAAVILEAELRPMLAQRVGPCAAWLASLERELLAP
jgi:hypothetical protein